MSIADMSQITHWEGKRVVVRAGLNVPIAQDGSVSDDFRIQRMLPTLSYLQEQGAKVVVLAHIGRTEESLEPVYRYLAQDMDIIFKPNFFSEDIHRATAELDAELSQAPNGQLWLVDNLRQSPDEQANNQSAAHALGGLFDIYINEAFSVSHRRHMSMHSLPQQIPVAVAGYACSEEVARLGSALRPPDQSVAIISGNKFETKLPLIKSALNSYGLVIVGGALANTLYQLQGHQVGKSLREKKMSEEMRHELVALLAHPKLYLPQVVVCSKGQGEKITKHIIEVANTDYIYDIAPMGLADAEPAITRADLVVWNGPLGYYEGGYSEGTKHALELVSASPADSIIGGGNTVDAARSLGFGQKISFLSTGGGAMINFLTHGTLPALETLHS